MSEKKVVLADKTGQRFVITYDGLAQQLGICDIKWQIGEIERRLDRLEKPIIKEDILELLKKETKFRSARYIERRIVRFRIWFLEELVQDEKVVVAKSGNRRMYAYLKRKENE